jgi:hypothetical protein
MKAKTYIIIIILVFLTLLSCEKKHDEIKNTYHIISFIYTNMLNELDVPPPLPSPPPLLEGEYSQEQKDSIDLSYLRLRKSLISENLKKGFYKKEKKIVAISKEFMQVGDNNLKLDDSDYSNLLTKLKSIKKIKEIDISKIYTVRKDSTFYFDKNLLTKDSQEFNAFDFLVSFSQVIFNENYERAIVVGAVSKSKLSGVSIIYFLKKTENGRWLIEYEKGLSIS